MTWLRWVVREGLSNKVTFVLQSEDEKQPDQHRMGGKRLLGEDTVQASSGRNSSTDFPAPRLQSVLAVFPVVQCDSSS